jgi:nicotinamide riboside kinase
MSVEKRLKIAFIGTHGVGKTTLCYGLAARLKRLDVALDVVHEVARRCPLPINEETGLASESWILHNQIADELVSQARYPVVICDRSALDNYVYLLLSAGRKEGLDALVDWWMATYDLLIYVPICNLPSDDGFRSDNPAFQRAVDERLKMELERRRLDTLFLDSAARPHWLDTVEEIAHRRLEPAQLPLL